MTVHAPPRRTPIPESVFRGQFAHRVDRMLYEQFFRGVRGGTFIECGAYDGVHQISCAFFEEQLGWRGIYIEADPVHFSKLIENRPTSTCINVGLSDREGEATFFAPVREGQELRINNGSLAHTEGHRETLLTNGYTFEEHPVKTSTYRELQRAHRWHRIDLMVLDIEGHEPAAIAGMTGAPVLPRFLCVETAHRDVPAMDDLLAPLGYLRRCVSYVNAVYELRRS